MRINKTSVILLGTALWIAVSILFFSSESYALTFADANASFQKPAAECINESYKILQSLQAENFSILRINDTIRQAEQIYAAQAALKLKSRFYNFSIVIDYCEDVKSLQGSAFKARDAVSSLLKFYKESISEGMNTSSIDVIMGDIESEMKDERYEKVPALIDRAYSEITKVQSSYTSLSIFYESTAKGFKAFMTAKNKIFQISNWLVIVLSIVVLFVAYIFYRVRIHIWLTNRKIESLKVRRKTVKELVMKTQKDYFQYGKISEGDFNIKSHKFAELIRDIDRQIPLLQEELLKFQRAGNKK